MAFDAVSFVEKVPESVDELNERNDKHLWTEAMEREIRSIEKNNTWKEVKKLEGAKILNTKWVFASREVK